MRRSPLTATHAGDGDGAGWWQEGGLNVVDSKDIQETKSTELAPLNWIRGCDTEASDLGDVWTVVTGPGLRAWRRSEAGVGDGELWLGRAGRPPRGRWV